MAFKLMKVVENRQASFFLTVCSKSTHIISNKREKVLGASCGMKLTVIVEHHEDGYILLNIRTHAMHNDNDMLIYY